MPKKSATPKTPTKGTKEAKTFLVPIGKAITFPTSGRGTDVERSGKVLAQVPAGHSLTSSGPAGFVRPKNLLDVSKRDRYLVELAQEKGATSKAKRYFAPLATVVHKAIASAAK